MKKRQQISFIYRNQAYNIDSIRFKKHSNYFLNQKFSEGKILVNLVDEFDSMQNFTVNTINIFLKYFIDNDIDKDIKTSNVLQLNFLSKKYKIKPLTDKTEEYIVEHHEKIIFDFLTKGDQFEDEENEKPIDVKKIKKTKKKRPLKKVSKLPKVIYKKNDNDSDNEDDHKKDESSKESESTCSLDMKKSIENDDDDESYEKEENEKNDDDDDNTKEKIGDSKNPTKANKKSLRKFKKKKLQNKKVKTNVEFSNEKNNSKKEIPKDINLPKIYEDIISNHLFEYISNQKEILYSLTVSCLYRILHKSSEKFQKKSKAYQNKDQEMQEQQIIKFLFEYISKHDKDSTIVLNAYIYGKEISEYFNDQIFEYKDYVNFNILNYQIFENAYISRQQQKKKEKEMLIIQEQKFEEEIDNLRTELTKNYKEEINLIKTEIIQKLENNIQQLNDTIKKQENQITDLKLFIFANMRNVEVPEEVQAPIFSKFALPLTFKTIDNELFNQCSYVREIIIPSSVKSIEEDAFNNCSSLISITLPDSINEINNFTFYYCTSLTQITIPSSVTTIGEGAFCGCRRLTQISIPSSVTSIGEGAFYNCIKIAQISIPSSVTSIGNDAFERCSSLTQITIPSSVTSIGNNTFKHCYKLAEISFEIPSSITSIGCFAFSKCRSLRQLKIPSSVTEIGSNAFSKCISLQQITIPSSVTEIGEAAFNRCTSLSKVFFENTSPITTIKSNTFAACCALTEISIPFSVEQIGKGAFRRCTSLKEVLIPSSIIRIEEGSFDKCTSLTELIFENPSSIEYIENWSFAGCPLLENVKIESEITEIQDDLFENCSSLKCIKYLEFEIPLNKYVDINNYEIEKKIYDYCRIELFKASNYLTDEQFAIKKIKFGNLKGFLHTINLIPNINGILQIRGYNISDLPNISKIFQYLNDHEDEKMNANYTVITDFMNNGKMKEYITEYLNNEGKSNTINPTIRSKIIFGVASTMKKLHERNIYKIDLTHDNIYLDENFEPRINIFSFSKYILKEYEPRLEDYCYIAPEANQEYIPQSDVYSFAIFLYKMFSTTVSFKDYVKQIKPKNMPDNYWELIQKCWVSNPYNRPTFAEIVDILKGDEYSINEFGMETDLEELHEYQARIES